MEGIDAPKQVPTAAGGVSGPQPRQHSSGLPSIPYSGVSPGSLAPMTYDQLIQSDFGQQPGMLWMPVFLPPPQADSDPGASGLKPFQQSPVASLNSWPRPEQNVGSEASTARGGSFLPSPDKRGMEQLSLSPPVKGEMSPKKKGKVEDRSSAQDKEAGSNDTIMVSCEGGYEESNWDSVTEPVMHIVFDRLSLRDQRNCRLVSKRWSQMVITNVKAMQPQKPKMQVLEERFGRVESLDFCRCEQLRNRNLNTLAASKKLVISHISIGHLLLGQSHIKPRITNKGLEYIASMTSLRSVRLAECNPVTNSGIMLFSRLTNLQQLSFIRCTRISEKGMLFLHQLPRLEILTIFSCGKVSDGLLEVLKAVTQLRALHLGHVRLSRESLESYSADGLENLKELTVHGVEVTPGSLVSMATFTHLTALGFTNLYQVDAEQTMTMLGRLTGLRRLNLLSVEELGNEHLQRISEKLIHLQHLKIIVERRVTATGIENLASLTSLKACTFESTHATAQALNAVSCLTQLTTVEFPGSDMPSELLNALPYLPHLESLGLQNLEIPGRVRPNRQLSIGSLEPLLRCFNLRRLDLSHTDMSVVLTNELLTKLRDRDIFKGLQQVQLEELCLRGCTIKDENLETMQSYFPWVNCHRKQRATLESSTWVWE